MATALSSASTAAGTSSASPSSSAGAVADAARAAASAEVCCPPACEPPLSAAEAARHAPVLKALADPQRLRMLSLIAAQPADEPLCVCDIESGFDLTQGTVSHHLRVLREAGLITVTKQGLWHYYAPAPEGLAPVKALLEGLGT